jgi:hypothetical protein
MWHTFNVDNVVAANTAGAPRNTKGELIMQTHPIGSQIAETKDQQSSLDLGSASLTTLNNIQCSIQVLQALQRATTLPEATAEAT